MTPEEEAQRAHEHMLAFNEGVLHCVNQCEDVARRIDTRVDPDNARQMHATIEAIVTMLRLGVKRKP
jgi:hypothetical protein